MRGHHFIQLVMLSAFWGASFPLIRIASPVLGPWGLAGIRCILAAMVLGLLMRILRQRLPPIKAWWRLAALSAVTVAIPFVLFAWAGLHIPAGYSAMLNAVAPLFGVLTAALCGDEVITRYKLLGCSLGFAGVGFLVQLGPVAVTESVLMAAIACVAAAACYGAGTIFMKRAMLNHGPLAVSAMVHMVAALLLAAPAGLTVSAISWSVDAAIAVAILGIVTSGLMYWMSMRLLREIPASIVTSSTLMTPFFGVIWGVIFLGEAVTWGMLPGCLLVLAAMALITIDFSAYR